MAAGGGGSGYVYTSSTKSNYPSGCLLNESYYLTDASTTAGNVAFTSPTGTSETGHTGDGYCRITVIESEGFLPIEKCEYIKAQNNAYINTDYAPNNNTKIEIKFKPNTNTSQDIISARDSSSGPYFILRYGNNSTQRFSYRWASNSIKNVDISTYNQEETVVTLDGPQFNINTGGTTSENTVTSGGTFSMTTPLTIFAMNTNGSISNYSTANIYYCKIWESNKLIREFIPVKYGTQYGLYDKIENKFYGNLGSGTITGSK